MDSGDDDYVFENAAAPNPNTETFNTNYQVLAQPEPISLNENILYLPDTDPIRPNQLGNVYIF